MAAILNVLRATSCFMNARNTIAAGRARVLLFRSPTHASAGTCDDYLDRVTFRGKNLEFLTIIARFNDHLSLSRSRYPISVSEKRNSTPIASSFSHAHTDSWRAYARSKVSRHIWMGGPPTHRKYLEVKEWNGSRTTPRTEFQVCGGVRVWRYRFCRVGPLELVVETRLKINRKAYYDVMGVVGKIAHLDRHFHSRVFEGF